MPRVFVNGEFAFTYWFRSTEVFTLKKNKLEPNHRLCLHTVKFRMDTYATNLPLVSFLSVVNFYCRIKKRPSVEATEGRNLLLKLTY